MGELYRLFIRKRLLRFSEDVVLISILTNIVCTSCGSLAGPAPKLITSPELLESLILKFDGASSLCVRTSVHQSISTVGWTVSLLLSSISYSTRVIQIFQYAPSPPVAALPTAIRKKFSQFRTYQQLKLIALLVLYIYANVFIIIGQESPTGHVVYNKFLLRRQRSIAIQWVYLPANFNTTARRRW